RPGDSGTCGEGRSVRAHVRRAEVSRMSAVEGVLSSQQALGDASVPLSLRGPAPTRVVAGFGFWLFLLSDILIFAALFAAYAVLSGETAGGPTGPALFDKHNVLI